MAVKKKKVKKPVKKTKSTEISPLAVFSKTQRVVFREGLEGELLLVVLDDLDTYYKIDGAAVEQWQLIDGKRSFDAIVNLMVKKSGCEKEFILKKSEAFFSDLLGSGLVTKRK